MTDYTKTIDYSGDCNCSTSSPENPPIYQGQKGTTLWKCTQNPIYLSANGGNTTISFTDTHPRYGGTTDACLLTFRVHTSDDSNNDVVVLNTSFNGSNDHLYHSKRANHDITEVIELVAGGQYISQGVNEYVFTNNSDVTVQLWDLRVIRAYAMAQLGTQVPGSVTADSAGTGTIDSTREDYPCNYESYGNRFSFTHYGGPGSALNSGDIPKDDSLSWTFYNPPTTNPTNYIEAYACFFNLNHVRYSGAFSGEDIHYVVELNGNIIQHFYLPSKDENGVLYGAHQAAGIDLTQWGTLFNNAPNANNTLKVYHEESSPITLKLRDGEDQQEPGRVDMYRFYKVSNLAQDNFNDTTIDTHIWNSLSIGNSQVSENNQLQVAVTSAGSWSQAGYATNYAYDTQQLYGSTQQGFEAAIDVANVNNLYEMNFLISSDNKRTDIDPSGLNNWYRIMKDRTDTTVKIQKRLNGGSVSSIWRYWNASTGQLKIKVAGGSIAFYENGTLRHAEPFMLPSSRCNLYAYTSSNTAGTGAFDNFYIKPAEGVFKDDFEDGNYNGWTVDSGSWSVSNGKLQSSQQGAHIHCNQSFTSPNRYVAADIQTLSSNGTAYVPFLMVNEVNGSNMIYADIRTDGKVELVLFYGGTPTNWQASSSLNSYSSNRIAVSISGTNAKVYVNNTLYLDVTNNNFANISNGYVGLWTYQSTGTMDNVLVFTQ